MTLQPCLLYWQVYRVPAASYSCRCSEKILKKGLMQQQLSNTNGFTLSLKLFHNYCKQTRLLYHRGLPQPYTFQIFFQLTNSSWQLSKSSICLHKTRVLHLSRLSKWASKCSALRVVSGEARSINCIIMKPSKNKMTQTTKIALLSNHRTNLHRII